MIFLELFYTFFIIGLFTIGGGYAMLPLIQHKVCTEHAWITDGAFTDMIAISQMTPGPIGINFATYIGYSVINEWASNSSYLLADGASVPTFSPGMVDFLSVLGSFTATTAVVLPSFLIVLALCKIYTRFCHSTAFEGMMMGLRPTVVGMIAAAAVLLVTPENFPDWRTWAIFAVSFAVAMFTPLHPILLLLLAGLAGFLIF